MSTRLKRIGIFGGSFDPPHLGHLVIAEMARRTLKLDVVYLVPAYQPPHKAGRHASNARERLAMTRLSVRGNSSLRVSDIEIRRRGVSYTIDTVGAFRHRFASAELFLIIGSDSLQQFRSWKDPGGILSMASLAVYRRPLISSRLSKVPGTKVHRIKGPMMDLSSSDIRQRLHDGKGISEMVRASVLRFIIRKRLYQSSTQK